MAGKRKPDHAREVAFASLKALGVSNPEAYLAVKTKGNGNRKTARNEGYLLSKHQDVAEMIEKMRDECKNMAPVTKQMLVNMALQDRKDAENVSDKLKAVRLIGDLEHVFLTRSKDETDRTDVVSLIARLNLMNPKQATELAKMYSDRSMDSDTDPSKTNSLETWAKSRH